MVTGRRRGAVLIAAVLTPIFAAVQSPIAAGATEAPWIDTNDRAAVVDAYLAEFDRVEPASG
jgi:hypothetical protein